jgi:hypothetical protein
MAVPTELIHEMKSEVRARSSFIFLSYTVALSTGMYALLTEIEHVVFIPFTF